ncbi:hypothetical protein QR680_010050 [Steinernema hermaphroditum]|uniref:Uncharacterized protein n=1 Tax=Steinernema hermaphroditum TaxID=289476 RepID=A0AA39IPG0_9BILA|nr:hypothetical protein QR680_010050 [Steinernema hermaphroditum]
MYSCCPVTLAGPQFHRVPQDCWMTQFLADMDSNQNPSRARLQIPVLRAIRHFPLVLGFQEAQVDREDLRYRHRKDFRRSRQDFQNGLVLQAGLGDLGSWLLCDRVHHPRHSRRLVLAAHLTRYLQAGRLDQLVHPFQDARLVLSLRAVPVVPHYHQGQVVLEVLLGTEYTKPLLHKHRHLHHHQVVRAALECRLHRAIRLYLVDPADLLGIWGLEHILSEFGESKSWLPTYHNPC